MIFKKSDNALLFWLIICDFFPKYKEQVFLTIQNWEMNMPQIFNTKFILNFRKYKSRKKFKFGRANTFQMTTLFQRFTWSKYIPSSHFFFFCLPLLTVTENCWSVQQLTLYDEILSLYPLLILGSLKIYF